MTGYSPRLEGYTRARAGRMPAAEAIRTVALVAIAIASVATLVAVLLLSARVGDVTEVVAAARDAVNDMTDEVADAWGRFVEWLEGGGIFG